MYAMRGRWTLSNPFLCQRFMFSFAQATEQGNHRENLLDPKKYYRTKRLIFSGASVFLRKEVPSVQQRQLFSPVPDEDPPSASQPSGPEAECVTRIAGPMRSSKAAIRSAPIVWESARSTGSGPYRGELNNNTDVIALAGSFSTFLFGLSIQARDGATLEELNSVISLMMRLWDTNAA